MHELSIAQSLLGIVLQEAGRHGANRVTKVAVKIGALASVVPSSLTFSFDLIKEGTPAADAVLEIERVPAMGICRACGARMDMSGLVEACPDCGSKEIELSSGQELYVDHIEAE
ncbi:MAG: hydrogenase maturation nickel metallochaperone HypA [Proteobacteria bacterium]|nr:hydrogenase maturation nickel metallochaperone HypA [Pseudomonadota bacterium]MBU1449797.1 hydrogenase maturation nickel metallochaperone HypA [Pseudomonadota bacterium]MBU2468186.1 hydrogenase maturation nickel metallochaperone HypA [Pseudomonadota bacterium]